MQSIQEFYKQNVRGKSAAERLQLATLILNDIPPQSLQESGNAACSANLPENSSEQTQPPLDTNAPPYERAPSARELLKLPLEERDRILSAQAALLAEEYRTNPDLNCFEAFGPNDFYDQYPEDAFKPTETR